MKEGRNNMKQIKNLEYEELRKAAGEGLRRWGMLFLSLTVIF